MPARTRSRRTVLTVAAAAFVVLAPTACDYAVASTGTPDASSVGSGHDGRPGHHGQPGHDGPGGHGGAPTASGAQTVPAGAVGRPDPQDRDGADADTGGPSTTAAPLPDADGKSGPRRGEDRGGSRDGGSRDGDSRGGDSRGGDPVQEAPPASAGLEVLADDCTTSDLEPHDGFQNAPRCVAIAFGEVAGADRSPSLLITDSPDTVAPGEAFTLEVSTRNLVRDRFLGAAAGGYYRESSVLDDDGIQRGHFHTACRLLPSVDEAPDAEPAPEFFLATQDNGGGAGADSVEVPVPGIEGAGELQCTVWAGDGSHRVPMMQRANQTPAFDAVRITVG